MYYINSFEFHFYHFSLAFMWRAWTSSIHLINKIFHVIHICLRTLYTSHSLKFIGSSVSKPLISTKSEHQEKCFVIVQFSWWVWIYSPKQIFGEKKIERIETAKTKKDICIITRRELIWNELLILCEKSENVFVLICK